LEQLHGSEQVLGMTNEGKLLPIRYRPKQQQ